MGSCLRKMKRNSLSISLEEFSSIQTEINKTTDKKKISEIVILPSNKIIIKTDITIWSPR